MNHKGVFHYFGLGLTLMTRPGLKRFVLLPMLANIVVMSLLFYWLFSSILSLVYLGLSYVPSWLQWLGYIVMLIVTVAMVLFFCYFFSTITNIIAAPFNGLLSEKVEEMLTGMPASDSSIGSVVKDIPRVMKREMQKLFYYLIRAIPLLLTYFIPIFGQFITPILLFIFTAWMLNMQYADYAFDNHKVSFAKMRVCLAQDKVESISFGVLVTLFTMIPVLNLIIMPIAVCGSTAIWVDRYRNQIYPSKPIESRGLIE